LRPAQLPAHDLAMVTEPVETAQTIYAAMLRTVVAPRLRALGFKGSGSSYVLPDDDWWLIVAFQKNRYSGPEWVSFTVNLTVANKAAWAADREMELTLPIHPSGNTSYLFGTEKLIRLGNLMPPRGEDRWWEVGPSNSSELAALQVGNAIERLAIPWLQAQSRPTTTSDIPAR
jgi:hypothetical protein